MRTVKLIALDLDGTLIPESQRVSLKDAQALRRAQAAGIPVVLATGRLYPSTRKWIRSLGIHTPVICCSGADIREGGKSVHSSTIAPQHLERAYRTMEAYEAKRYVYCGDRIYCTKEDFDEILFNKWGKKEVEGGLVVYRSGRDEILRETGGSAIKFVVRTPDSREHPAIEEATGSLQYFDIVRGEALHFEFTRRGTNKAEALKRIAAGMGIKMQDVLAVGDSMNDYEMIRASGTGVAMGNAMRAVKNVADELTLPVWENGVAYAISRYVFGEDPAWKTALETE